MEKVALIIIYNHKFDQNIDVLERLYQHRFSHIYHLVPFYTGNKENVIPVYENSFYFQGYVAQGLQSFYKEAYGHYFFVADDLVINPLINEHNYREHLGLQEHSCFLPEYINLHECNKAEKRWERIIEAFHFKLNNTYGVETKNECPDYAGALQAFEKHGLHIGPFQYHQITTPVNKPDWMKWKEVKAYLMWKLRLYKKRHKLYHAYYPVLGSYADIFVVSAHTIKQFAHYCGVFAANKLFVEFAIPTAMALAAEEIVIEKNIQLHGKALWTVEELMLLDKYDFSINKLMSDFPRGFLYLHPIKLSKWK